MDLLPLLYLVVSVHREHLFVSLSLLTDMHIRLMYESLKNKTVGCNTNTTLFPQDSIKFRHFHNLDCGATRTKQRSMHGPNLNLPFVLVL